MDKEKVVNKKNNCLYLVCNNIFKDYYVGESLYNGLPHLIIKVPIYGVAIDEESNSRDTFLIFNFNNDEWYYDSNLNRVYKKSQYIDFLNKKLYFDKMQIVYNNFKIFNTYIDSLKYLEDLYCKVFHMGFSAIGYNFNDSSTDIRFLTCMEYKGKIDFEEYKKLKEELFKKIEDKEDKEYKIYWDINDYNEQLKFMNEKIENVKKHCILYKDLKYNYDNRIINEEKYKKEIRELFSTYYTTNEGLLSKYLSDEDMKVIRSVCNLNHIGE